MYQDHYARAPHHKDHKAKHGGKKGIEIPNRKVLVLAALCISVIAIILGYKISEAEQQKAQTRSGGELSAGVSDEAQASDSRISEALNQAELDSAGVTASSTNPFNPSPSDNVSDTFSKDLFRDFAKEQSTGQDMPDDQLSSDVISDIKTSGMPKPSYVLSQLATFSPTGSADIHQYGNSFAAAYLNAIKPIKDNPQLYNTNIDALAELYKSVAASIIEIRVPGALAEDQLDLANDFSMMSQAFGLVDGQQKDPVQALLGLRVIQDSMKSQVQVFTDMQSYFSQNGIVFSDSEAGSIWNQVAPDPSALQSSDTSTNDTSN